MAARPFSPLAVIGGGAWGTALAKLACEAGTSARLWLREEEAAREVAEQHRNSLFLPGIDLPEDLEAGSDLGAVVRGAEALLLVVPSQFLRAVCRDLKPLIPEDLPLLIAAKGIEGGSGALLIEVVAEELPSAPLAVLSGPTFAGEAAQGLPTAAVIAARPGAEALAERFAATLGTRTFRLYLSDDPRGVGVGGAAKNVIAIACGIATGLGFGANTRAALITRGLAEMQRLALAAGGKPETLSGLAGLGDLTLTCSSEQSRNFTLGLGLGRGTPRAEIFGGRPVVVEGEENAHSVTALARRLGVEMPICEAVRAVLDGELSLSAALEGLLSRPTRREGE